MENDNTEISAIRLKRDSTGKSFFEKGKIKTHSKIKATEFWFANKIDDWQIGSHKAPRKQFVITLSGKLEFTVSDHSTFILEPGIILLAEDIEGDGHTWKMIDGHENWHRIYIPMLEESDLYFIKD